MNKLCRSKTCKETVAQSVENFVKDKRYADGYQNRCKACQKQYDKLRFDKNRKKILQQCKSYYESNLEVARAKRTSWRENNRGYAAQYGKLYRQLNPGKELAKTRKYALAKLNAVPDWLTKEQVKEIERIYTGCPDGYEVDHQVPLQGKNVCGLHVPWNLQHLPRKENRKKGNKY